MKIRIGEESRDFRALWWESDALWMIDQRLLPLHLKFLTLHRVEEVAEAIKHMAVRGAPSIGAAAAFGMALAARSGADLTHARALLAASRPTARDLFHALEVMDDAFARGRDPVSAAQAYADGIVEACRAIGRYGAALLPDGARVLTHCNAGALAAVDVGTALAPLREAHAQGKSLFVFADETRPRLQGLLTAWELFEEGIPHALIADNAAGHYLYRGEVDAVIVGADRITANGDFANKIGTYEKAVLAERHGVPFYVAAPFTTVDTRLRSGREIPIEERAEEEVLMVNGHRFAHPEARARNPAFDVTPASLVTAFITERGIVKPGDWARVALAP
ncbi:MAG TPA: S-methyl-5-thioribose-1-phosphate isomerase [Candidatus Thermoplasmatota archaeon]|nr:S-methyl-5-thioribose-1-phosphate isomerase [Candidatus Thermoplasmatota archaeon]